MRQILSITRHEFYMFIRRPGYWIAYLLMGALLIITQFSETSDYANNVIPSQFIWVSAGKLMLTFNVLLPLLAGILTADRMQRDFTSGLRELQSSAPLPRGAYILAKYLACLAGGLLPVFILTLIIGGGFVALGIVTVNYLGPLLLAFLAIAVPAHAFVTAFSLACPLIMPLRVYQVLFTGYWFWGNFLSPEAFPSISDTVLNAAGVCPLEAYFNKLVGGVEPLTPGHTVPEAVINLLLMISLIVLALFMINLYLRQQSKQA